MENIQDLHNELFEFLEDLRSSDADFKDLKYTLRRDNFGNKLQEGYWFLGDENVLVLSFWNGVNIYNNKKPNVSLNFDFNKSLIYIEISFEKSQKNFQNPGYNKSSFISKVIYPAVIESELPTTVDFKELESYSKYTYRIGKLQDWQRVLIQFISSVKQTIDRLLGDYQPKLYFQQNIPGSNFEFIDDKEFAKNIRKVKKYRTNINDVKEFEKSSYNNSNRPSYLEEFEVLNFGPIKSIKIEPLAKHNKWIFITGANGSGKSLLIKAIALTLGQGMVPKPYLNSIDVPYFKAKFYSSNSDQEILERSGNDKKTQNARRTLLTGFAAYGIHRTTIRKNLNLAVGNHELSKNGFLESILGEKNSPLIDFNKTIQEWTDSRFSREKFQHRRDFFIKALITTVPYFVDIHFVEKKRNYSTEFFFKYDDGEVFSVTYDQLSTGTKSILSFVADIIIRFYKQQPEAYDPSEFRGVVIVDEIDLHLHPQGQKDLILALNEVFPNIQFIVSTHSPIPLLAAPKNSIVYRIERNSAYGISAKRIDTLIHLEDLLPNTILTSPIFGMDSIVNSNRDNSSRINTQDDYRDVELSQKLKSRIDDFLTDRKQEELIQLFEERRK